MLLLLNSSIIIFVFHFFFAPPHTHILLKCCVYPVEYMRRQLAHVLYGDHGAIYFLRVVCHGRRDYHCAIFIIFYKTTTTNFWNLIPFSTRVVRERERERESEIDREK